MHTTKKESSQRQIEVAIQLLRDQKLDCAITLAAAGEGILPPTEDPHLFAALQPHNAELEINLVINWLKHSKENDPEEAQITEFEAVIVIARAITKFVAVYHQSSQPFEDFLRWGHEAGHIPRMHR